MARPADCSDRRGALEGHLFADLDCRLRPPRLGVRHGSGGFPGPLRTAGMDEAHYRRVDVLLLHLARSIHFPGRAPEADAEASFAGRREDLGFCASPREWRPGFPDPL